MLLSSSATRSRPLWSCCVALVLVHLFASDLAADTGLVITEVHQGNPEFLELQNLSGEALDLEGYRLTGDLQHTFLQSLVLGPGEGLVVAQSVLEFRERFVDFPASQQLVGCWGRIRNEGGQIRLHDSQGAEIDLACYRKLVPGQSVHRRFLRTPYRGHLNWRLGLPTPGRVVTSPEAQPLLVDQTRHSPRQPGPAEPVQVRCRINGERPLEGYVEWWGPRIERRSTPVHFEAPGPGGVHAAAILPPRPNHSTIFYEWVLRSASSTSRVASDSLSGEPFSVYSSSPVQTRLPCYSLELSPEDLARLQASPAQQRFQAQLAVTEPGSRARPLGQVSLQARGRASGRRWPKRSWVLQLERGRYRGMRGVLLRTSWRDPLGLRRVLGFELYGRAGVLAPRARLVRVELNGEFLGLYTEVEPLGKAFLARNGRIDAGLARPRQSRQDPVELQCDGRALSLPSLYEASWVVDDEQILGELRRFLEGLAESDDSQAHLERSLDLDRYLRYLAVTILLHHWDSVNRNFTWCFDRDRLRWEVIPWDLDRTWGDHYEGLWLVSRSSIALGTRARPISWGGRRWWNRVRTAVLEQPPLVERLRAILAELTEREFTVERIGARARELVALARPEILADAARWKSYTSRYDGRLVEKPRTEGHVERELVRLETFVASRRRFLRAQGARPVLSARRDSWRDLALLLGLSVLLGVYVARGGLRAGTRL